jgi:hypothetical protein
LRYIFLYLALFSLGDYTQQNNFTGGQYSPLMEARTDFEKYKTGLRQLENMIPRPQGDVSKRPGTKYIDVVRDVDFTRIITRQNVFMAEGNDLRVMTSITGKRLLGDARNIGGGLVGLPCEGHEFSSGDTIQIAGTTNYDTVSGTPATVHATTTTDEIVITGGFAAETFDGTPVVMLYFEDYFDNTVSGGGSCQLDNYMYVPCGYDAGSPTCIVRVNMTDYTLESDWASAPPSGWTVGQSGWRVRPVGDYLYLACNDPQRIYKYDTSGNCIWEFTGTSTLKSYDMDVDINGRVYRSGYKNPANFSLPMRTEADGSAADLFYNTLNSLGALNGSCATMAAFLDEDNGKVYFMGDMSSVGATVFKYMMYRFPMGSATSDYSLNIAGATNGDSVNMAMLIDGAIYCITDTFTYGGANKNIFKLDLDLNVTASALLANLTSIYTEGDYLYAVRNSATYAGDDTIYRYDLDLANPTAINAGEVERDAAIINHNFFQVYTEYETQITTTEILPDDYVFRVIPFEYSTEDNYILGFGDNYLCFFREGGVIEE